MVFAASDKIFGTRQVIVQAQKEVSKLHPKVDYLLNCKFKIDATGEKYGCWITGDAYYKNNTTSGNTDTINDN